MMGDCVTDVGSAFQFGLFVRMSGNGNIIYHVKIQCEGPLYQSQISGEESVEHKSLRAIIYFKFGDQLVFDFI